MTDVLETRALQQLPPATAASPDAVTVVQEPDGPAQKLKISQLLGRLISTNAAKETRPDLYADLNYAANMIGLVYADPDPAFCGWYRKTGAVGAGGWAQFEKLTGYASAEIGGQVALATTARVASEVARDAILAFSNFKTGTLAAAEAATAVGVLFSVEHPAGIIGLRLRTADGSVEVQQTPVAPFASTTTLLASTRGARGPGTEWRAGAFRYAEAAADAADHHLTTAAGVKLYALAEADGQFNAEALGLTSPGNKAAALSALTAAGVRYITIPRDKTLTLTSTAIITATADIRIDGEGMLDCSGGGRLVIDGGSTALPALAANITEGDTYIPFVAAHGLAIGDTIRLLDPTEYSGGLARPYYHEGFFVIVAAVNSATAISIYGRAPESMLAAVTTVKKINGGSVDIGSSLRVIPNPANEGYSIEIANRVGVTFDRLAAPIGSGYGLLLLRDCYGGSCTDLRARVHGGDAYTFAMVGCQDFIFDKIVSSHSTRHALAISSGGSGPSRGIKVVNSFLTSAGIGASGDFHGGTVGGEFVNCTLFGLALGGRDHKISGCTIIAQQNQADLTQDARWLVATEYDGGTMTFENCRMIGYKPPETEGGIYLNCPFTRRDLRVEFVNCTWEYRRLGGSLVKPVVAHANRPDAWNPNSGAPPGLANGNNWIVSTAGTYAGITWAVGDIAVWAAHGAGKLHKKPNTRLDVRMVNPVVLGAQLIWLYTLLGDRDVTAKYSFAVEGNVSAPQLTTGVYFVPAAVANRAIKMRLPRQQITTTFAITSGVGELTTGVIYFAWIYPPGRRPQTEGSFWRDGAGPWLVGTTGDTAIYTRDIDGDGQWIQLLLRKIGGGNWGDPQTIKAVAHAWIDDLGNG